MELDGASGGPGVLIVLILSVIVGVALNAGAEKGKKINELEKRRKMCGQIR